MLHRSRGPLRGRWLIACLALLSIAPLAAHAQVDLVSDGSVVLSDNQTNQDLLVDLRQLVLDGGQRLLAAEPLAAVRLLSAGQCLVATPAAPADLQDSCITVRVDTEVPGCDFAALQTDDPALNGLTFLATAKTGQTDTGTLYLRTGNASAALGGACSAFPENSPPAIDQAALQNLQISGSPPSALVPLASAITDLDASDPVTVTITGGLDNGVLVFESSGAPAQGTFPVQNLRYLPNDPATFTGDSFGLLADDGRGGRVSGAVTFGAVPGQTWTSGPSGIAVSPADACAADAEGLTCALVPGGALTLNLADAVQNPTPGLTYRFQVQLGAASEEQADVGTVSPTSGPLTPGQQTLVTYQMPAANRVAALLTVIVTDSFQRSSATSLFIGIDPSRAIAPRALNPNQLAVATRVDFVCERLQRQAGDPNDPTRPPPLAGQPLTAGESQLLRQCGNLTSIDTSNAEVEVALQSIAAEEVAAQKRSVLDVGRDHNRFLGSRIAALRGGARGISIAGLDLNVDGRSVPLGLLEPAINRALGGGAAADDPDSIASRLGLFIQGKLSFGDQRETPLESGFDFDGTLLMAGIDYRFSPELVLGLSGSYGSTKVEFARESGRLDSRDYALGFYGYWYPTRRLFLDFLGTYGTSDFAQTRNIRYGTGGLGGTPVEYRTEALGNTDGRQLSAGLNAGVDLSRNRWSFTPALKVFFIDGTIDAFEEGGAAPTAQNPDARAWDLAFPRQDFRSLTASAGLQLAYTWLPKWGVVRPHLRADAVREFEDGGRVLIVRLVNDLQETGPLGSPSGPITVTTERADSTFFTLGAGLSVQWKRGLSGFVDYQRLEGYSGLRSESVALGLRFELSF